MLDVPMLVLTGAQRQKLKQPLGELITGTPSECIRALKEVLGKEKPSSLLLVGDTVSRNAIQSGIRPDVTVIDNKEMRAEAMHFEYQNEHFFRAKNAAGTIDLEAWEAIEKATRTSNSIILVEGEEDLLALIVIIVAPSGALVVYGQPQQGIVLVRVSPEKKKEVERIVEEMERRS